MILTVCSPRMLNQRDRALTFQKEMWFYSFLIDFLVGKESKLALATNLKELSIQFVIGHYNERPARWIIEKFLEAPHRLARLDLRILNNINGPDGTEKSSVARFRKVINEFCGVRGKFVGRKGRNGQKKLDRWIWRARRGAVLKKVVRETGESRD
jgi:hypothetical protein